MKDRFESLVQNCRRSIRHDPSTKDRGIEGYAKEIKGETEELLDAIKNKDQENITEELGDVLLNWLHAVLLAEEKNEVNVKEVLENVDEKLKRRKPYITEERTVSKSEAKQKWVNAKECEK